MKTVIKSRTKIPTDVKLVHLKVWVEEVITAFRFDIDANVELKLQIDKSLNGVMMDIDEDPLKDALYNLVKNGMKCGGVHTGITVACSIRDRSFKIGVYHQGAINIEVMEMIVNSNVKKEKDIIGLYQEVVDAKQLIDGMKGWLTADCRLEHTAFMIKLPTVEKGGYPKAWHWGKGRV